MCGEQYSVLFTGFTIRKECLRVPSVQVEPLYLLLDLVFCFTEASASGIWLCQCSNHVEMNEEELLNGTALV